MSEQSILDALSIDRVLAEFCTAAKAGSGAG